MVMLEFERMLDVMLQGAHSASVTLTEAPKQAGALDRLLDAAIASGRQRGRGLTRVELPIGDYPRIGERYAHVTLMDSGATDVVRMYFDA